MDNPKIEIDLAEVLQQINKKLDNLQSDIAAIRQEDIRDIKIKLENLDTRMSHVEKTTDKISDNQANIQENVSNLQGAKSLIIPIVVAVTTAVVTLVIRAIPIG